MKRLGVAVLLAFFVPALWAQDDGRSPATSLTSTTHLFRLQVPSESGTSRSGCARRRDTRWRRTGNRFVKNVSNACKLHEDKLTLGSCTCDVGKKAFFGSAPSENSQDPSRSTHIVSLRRDKVSSFSPLRADSERT